MHRTNVSAYTAKARFGIIRSIDSVIVVSLQVSARVAGNSRRARPGLQKQHKATRAGEFGSRSTAGCTVRRRSGQAGLVGA